MDDSRGLVVSLLASIAGVVFGAGCNAASQGSALPADASAPKAVPLVDAHSEAHVPSASIPDAETDVAVPPEPRRAHDASTESGKAHAVVTLFGKAGTFGGLARVASTPSGQSFEAVAVPGFAQRPGQTPYFSAVTPGGQVVIANSTQTDNQILSTATDMVVSVFRPTAPALENVVIPTSTGRTSAVNPYTMPPGIVGGADIADLELVDVGGEPRMAFISASPYDWWKVADSGLYPTLGFLKAGASGAWVYDTALSLTADDIAGRSALGAAACVKKPNLSGESVASCNLPAEMALLPASHAFVVTLYASPDSAHSGRLMVLRPDGVVLALLQYPEVRDADGTVLDVLPREVDADPTSKLGDERFCVVFDVLKNGAQAAFPLQEFRFDGSHIEPVSAPVISGERGKGVTMRFETALYDRHGNLWGAENEVGTLNGGNLAVYPKIDGRRTLETSCAAGADPAASFGTACPPMYSLAATRSAGSVRSFTEDPKTGTMMLATLNGVLVVVHPHGDAASLAFDAPPPIELGLGKLLDRSKYVVGVRKASVDVTARALYLPAMELQNDATCPAYPCTPAPLLGWLYRIDVDAI